MCVNMNHIKILFVDDNPVNLIAAENLMLSMGILIDKADNGETAIQMAVSEEYDLIFMDLMMPMMDGIMTTKLLRSRLDHRNKTKIIATSGIEMKEVEDYRYGGLFDGSIQKPIKLEQLKACLAQWIGQDRLLQLQLHMKEQNVEVSMDEWKLFIDAMETVKGIHLDYFLEFEKKDVDYFTRLIKSSIKQITNTIPAMKLTIINLEAKHAHEQLHALKSVLYYVGAHKLASLAEGLDAILVGEKEKQQQTRKFIENMQNYQGLIEQMTVICSELERAMNAYNSSIKTYQETLIQTTVSMDEINKRIEQILFHIGRFEYIEILNGLNYLTLNASEEMKPYFYQAVAALEEFDYEKVEGVLKDCWNI